MRGWWSTTGVAAIGSLLGGISGLGPNEPKPVSSATPTYAEHVAPILNNHCVSCHRPNEVAPFSLIGYDNAKKWSGMIAGVTSARQMPPWKAVHGYGEFANANTLSAAQIETLKQWHAAGAPRGNAQKVPPNPTFPSGDWSMGAPDIVLQPDKPFRLEAEGEDVYRNFVFKNTYDHPLWVRGIDVKPGNKKVVHHVIVFVDGMRQAQKLEAASKDGQPGYMGEGGGIGVIPTGTLGGWAPGVMGNMLPDNSAYKIEPNSHLVMQVHYHKSGQPETDQTRVGLYLAKSPPSKQMHTKWILNPLIDIPAGEAAYKSRRESTYGADGTLYMVMPHMHLLGRKMKSWLEFPDGRTQPLIYVDSWDFNWQLVYLLRQPISIPKGTKQIVEAEYDNSDQNPLNPSTPPRRVRWGEGTFDEMFLLISWFTRKEEKGPEAVSYPVRSSTDRSR
jgi:mono/diheme cytochrome c family protein